MGLDDTLKNEITTRARDLKARLVQEYDELTDRDLEDADDADAIVDRVQRKTGQTREQVESRMSDLVRR